MSSSFDQADLSDSNVSAVSDTKRKRIRRKSNNGLRGGKEPNFHGRGGDGAKEPNFRGRGGRWWRGREFKRGGKRGDGKPSSSRMAEDEDEESDCSSDAGSTISRVSRGQRGRRWNIGSRQAWRGGGGKGKDRNHGESRGAAEDSDVSDGGNTTCNDPRQSLDKEKTSKSEPAKTRVPDYTPDELDVIFKYLLKEFDGRVRLGTLMCERKYQFRGLTHAQAAACFKRSNRFRIYEKDGQVKWVSIKCNGARLCFSFRMRRQNGHKCDNEFCPYFHVCWDFVAGNCARGPRCKFGHSFLGSNEELTKKCGLDQYTDEEISIIFRRSMLVVCDNFNREQKCTDDCPDIHVCSKFTRRICSDDECKLGHQIKGTEHNDWVLNNYYMMKLAEKTLLMSVLVSRTGNESTASYNGKGRLSFSGSTDCLVQQTISQSVNVQGKALLVNESRGQKQKSPRLHQATVSTSADAGLSCRKPQASKQESTSMKTESDRLTHLSSTSAGKDKHPTSSPQKTREKSIADQMQGQAHKNGSHISQSSKMARIREDCQQNQPFDQFNHLCELYTWTGDCRKKRQCPRYHHYRRSPLLWQLLISGEWRDVADTDNSEIEERFCAKDPVGVFQVIVDNVGGLQLIIDFNQLRAFTVASEEFDEDVVQCEIQIRRWSTPSYVDADTTTPLNFYTQWVWYLNCDGRNFQPFSPDILQYTVEKKYCSSQKNYYFEKDRKRFLLQLQSMKLSQVGDEDYTGVLRRPFYALVDHGDTAALMSSYLLREHPLCLHPDLPSSWCSLDHYQSFEMVDMDCSSEEYRSVAQRFHFTLSRSCASIISIFRVQNPSQWDTYCSKRRGIQSRDTSNQAVDERSLFHGTPTLEAVRGICANSMDFRRSGENVGAIHGKGSYFSTKASYSHSYTRQPDRYMFLAKVLVGKFTKGHSSYTVPPVREGLNMYDSCVDDVNSPTIFVIFDLAQSYPEYLIHYEYTDMNPDRLAMAGASATRNARLQNVATPTQVPVTPIPRSFYNPTTTPVAQGTSVGARTHSRAARFSSASQNYVGSDVRYSQWRYEDSSPTGNKPAASKQSLCIIS